MEEVKRYTIDFSDGETAEGVLYDDYAALKARCEELEEHSDMDAELIQHLRAQLEAAKERHFQAVYELGVEIEKNEKKPQLTAQPDGVHRWRFVENYLGRACVAVEGSGELVLDTRTLDEQVSQACRLLVEAHNKALSAAPAREDRVRERRLELTLAEIEGRSNVTTGGHSTLAQRLERIHALAAQALAAPAPVCVCGHAKADHAEKHGWECSEECACLKYTPAPAPDEVK